VTEPTRPLAPGVIDAIGGLLPPLLEALDRLLWVQRHLHPPHARRLADELAPATDAVARPLRDFETVSWPEEFKFVRDRLTDAAGQTLDIVAAFVKAARSPTDPIDLYRAVRRIARVQETLYPLTPVFEAASRWFLDEARRSDDALVERLRAAVLREDDLQTGLLHADNERDRRGGFSLYVPETCDARTPSPLIVALHGGHGHGRDFLWTWLRDARSREALLIAPTSRMRTWSIMGGPDEDAEGLRQMVEFVAGRYLVDRARVLLTGMSDGATYALLCGLGEGMPFTHLAPACGALHPFLLAGGGIERARDRPIYLIHGALDWMFPVNTAGLARDVLTGAGAQLVYREIEDLSHTYPREENARILDWLISGQDPEAPTSGREDIVRHRQA
jgi:phospholipase/carboxylesterase